MNNRANRIKDQSVWQPLSAMLIFLIKYQSPTSKAADIMSYVVHRYGLNSTWH